MKGTLIALGVVYRSFAWFAVVVLTHLTSHICPAGYLEGIFLQYLFFSVKLQHGLINFLSAAKSHGAILGHDCAKERAKCTR